MNKMNLENTIKEDEMIDEKEKEIWSNQERQDSKFRYGCEILQEMCKLQDGKNKQLPTDSYLVTYINNGITYHDIIRTGKRSGIFDMYYDKFGNCLESIEWTEGKVNPRFWGYKPPQTKKRK